MFFNFTYEYEALFEGNTLPKDQVLNLKDFWSNRGILSFKSLNEKKEWINNIKSYAESKDQYYLIPFLNKLSGTSLDDRFEFPTDTLSPNIDLDILENQSFNDKFPESDKNFEEYKNKHFVKSRYINTSENPYFNLGQIFKWDNSKPGKDFFNETFSHFFKISNRVIIRDPWALENLIFFNDKKQYSGLNFLLKQIIKPKFHLNMKRMDIICSWPGNNFISFMEDKYKRYVSNYANEIDAKKIYKFYKDKLFEFLTHDTRFFNGGNRFEIYIHLVKNTPIHHNRYIDFDGYSWLSQKGLEIFGSDETIKINNEEFVYMKETASDILEDKKAIDDFNNKDIIFDGSVKIT